MPASINYKNKYLELRTKYMSDMDVAFRLGFEQGAQEAKQQQAMEAQQQAQESEMRMQEAQAAGMNGQPGAGGPPGAEGAAPGGPDAGGPPQAGAPQQSSELDQHIGKLESMLGSNASPEVKKSLQDIIDLRKAEKLSIDLKKGDSAIKGIVSALHKQPFKLSTQANHNMSDVAKKAVTLQHKIVTDIFKSWESEEANAKKDILTVLNVEGLVKG